METDLIGTVPDGIQNAIVNLCAALVIWEAEALQDAESLVLSVQVAEDAVERASGNQGDPGMTSQLWPEHI